VGVPRYYEWGPLKVGGADALVAGAVGVLAAVGIPVGLPVGIMLGVAVAVAVGIGAGVTALGAAKSTSCAHRK
jgi:hypothetical protein